MSEKCVVTFRVMFDTDQEATAKCYAEVLEEQMRGVGNPDVFLDTHDVLDVEISGYGTHGGRSFLYRDPATTTKGEW